MPDRSTVAMASQARTQPHPEAAVRNYFLSMSCRRRPVSFGLTAALLLAVPACHLIDQTDFDPPPPPRPAPPPIPNPEARQALVTIEYTKANPDYRATLATAIRAVEARRPGLLYDIVAVVGGPGDAPAGQLRAAEVMTAVEAEGVNPARIQLGVRLEPGRGVPQVRVYLR
jgi:hypothetical protein